MELNSTQKAIQSQYPHLSDQEIIDFTGQSKFDRIKNQYPHLSDQEIMDLLARSKADNIKNMYPHLTNQEVDKLIADSEKLKKAKAEARETEVRYIPSTNLNIEKIISGEYNERIIEFLAKHFSFLDFSAFTNDLTNVIDEFISRAKEHPEFPAAVEKLTKEFEQEKEKLEAAAKKPAARPRASRAKGGNAGAAGSKKKPGAN